MALRESKDLAGQSVNHEQASDWQRHLAGYAAVVVLIGFALVMVWLFMEAVDASDPEWTRYVYLLSGIEAVVFAAVGWLFGREVNRQRAESAEERADTADQQRTSALATAAREEQKGRSLAHAIHTKAQRAAPRDASAQPPGDVSRATPGDISDLAVLASRLYPDQ
jgi:hypothetical protein